MPAAATVNVVDLQELELVLATAGAGASIVVEHGMLMTLPASRRRLLSANTRLNTVLLRHGVSSYDGKNFFAGAKWLVRRTGNMGLDPDQFTVLSRRATRL